MVKGQVRKKVDTRVKTLVENGVKLGHRSMIVLVGDKGKEQVVNLHYILSKAQVKAQPSVLWCYKKELGFSTHRKKRMKAIKKKMKSGMHEVNEDDPFDLFVSSTNIRYTYYAETHNILGNTYGMCVLQDFEAINPNLLARTVETVEGGGLIVLLLRTMDSLTQLYDMVMDVHKRLRTHAHNKIVPRFNQRFMLSVAECEGCLIVDDELNVLPVSANAASIEPIGGESAADERRALAGSAQLRTLQESLRDTEPAGSLVARTRTLDQARALVTFLDAVAEKTLRTTVTLTAARGRGKSAALGLAIAGAVAFGYSNIFVTSPSPENLRTLFEFVFNGFDAIGFKEHLDYDVIQSTNPEFRRAVVRVNIFHTHRQTIQYIAPQDGAKITTAELVVIDEAAAIPLPVVRALFGPYLVFMASTVSGYEGTGRSLSLKLIDSLRRQTRASSTAGAVDGSSKTAAQQAAAAAATAASAGAAATSGRALKELTLRDPIRYSANDPIERWLNSLLCLEAQVNPSISVPHPSKCELYYVNRDTLFSYHKVTEVFLAQMMALYVSSHYKNSPNDLMLMSDAPAHHLFVLMESQDALAAARARRPDHVPEILCVVQVALEGALSAEHVRATLGRGDRAQGDLIPWTLSQQFQDQEFSALNGARIVRIATHPNYTRMGYGSRALELLVRYYSGDFTNVADDMNTEKKKKKNDDDNDDDNDDMMSDDDDDDDDDDDESDESDSDDDDDDDDDDDKRRRRRRRNKAKEAAAKKTAKHESKTGGSKLSTERLTARKNLDPLLLQLHERRAERLHWIGTSFGFTPTLFSFWQRSHMVPVYMRLTANDITGEHSCIMLRALNTDAADLDTTCSADWSEQFAADFRSRFLSLLSYTFRSSISATAALTVVGARHGNAAQSDDERARLLTRAACDKLMSAHDRHRLRSYARQLLDYHVVLDLCPLLARLYFAGELGAVLPHSQALIILAIGLQHKSVDELERELSLPASQLLALFNKATRKLSAFLDDLHAAEIAAALPDDADVAARAERALGASQASATASALDGAASLRAELEESGRREVDKQQRHLITDRLGDLSQFAVAAGEKEFASALSEAKGAIPASLSVKSGAAKRRRDDDARRRSEQLQAKADANQKSKKEVRSKKYGYAP